MACFMAGVPGLAWVHAGQHDVLHHEVLLVQRLVVHGHHHVVALQVLQPLGGLSRTPLATLCLLRPRANVTHPNVSAWQH